LKDAAREHAWLKVKAAVHAYSEDPSQGNEGEVEAAWREIRRIDSVSHWREWQAARLKALEASAPPHSTETIPR
jgi:hypothetical protein